MPTALLPCVGKIIHRISDFVRPQEGEHAKSEEQHCHQQCCGCIGTTWERPLHVYKLHQLTPERYATRCFTCQRNDSLDVGERMRSWTYGCKPNEVPRAILSAFVLPTVPGKRPQ